MQELTIRVLRRKALDMLKMMQDQRLIELSDDPTKRLTSYLSETRKRAGKAPSLKEITALVEDVRVERYGKR